VIKFAEPLVYAQAYFVQRGYLNIVPKEAENTSLIDLRQKTIGTGPFLVSDYRASTSLNFKRHPDYWDKDKPYIEGIDYPVITEYAQVNAQFRNGNIHAYEAGSGAAVRQEEVVRSRRIRAADVRGDVTSTRAAPSSAGRRWRCVTSACAGRFRCRSTAMRG
jgi:ABC-type oligopeptide transport system substrate-binding subunit